MFKFLSWDLEISSPPGLPEDGEIPEGSNIWDYSPFHITVAGLHYSDTRTVETYCGWKLNDFTPAAWMSRDYANGILDKLIDAHKAGYHLVTWNGTSFDWRLLAQETGRHHDCKRLALASIDPMFQVVGIRGYPVGLQKVAETLGLGSKTQSGANAPAMWEAGLYQEVLDYVAMDAELLGRVVNHIVLHRHIKWTSSSGSVVFQPMHKLMSAGRVLTLPEPDTSWMDEPKTREDYIIWMEEN